VSLLSSINLHAIAKRRVASRAFLRVEGILGEAVDERHKDWIEVLSYEWSLGSFSVLHPIDKASPQLYLAYATGKFIPEIVVEVVSQAEIVEYRVADVILLSIQQTAREQGGSELFEEVVFGYGKISVTMASSAPVQESARTAAAITRRSRDELTAAYVHGARAAIDLLGLPLGWNSHGARRIAEKNVAVAIDVLGKFTRKSTPLATVVPAVQGGVQVEWHTRGLDIEIYIYSPEDVRFFVENRESGESVEGSLMGRENILASWIERISFELSRES
jgi:type VI secretion system secreted protein Hcp